jgi:hypothetical protein
VSEPETIVDAFGEGLAILSAMRRRRRKPPHSPVARTSDALRNRPSGGTLG